MKKLFFVVFFPLYLLSVEEFEVSLLTRSYLFPAYLSRVHSNNSDFSGEYLEKIRSVLLFDFKNGGFLTPVVNDPLKDEQLVKNIDQAVSWGMPYVMRAEVKGKQLTLQIYFQGKIKDFRILLTGELSFDRRSIHKLYDAVQEELFGKRGIFDHRILYTVRVPDPKEKDKWLSEIWICDADGENAKQVTKGESYAVTPLFIPQDNRCENFIFVSYKSGQPKLYFSSLNAEEAKPLVSLGGNQLLPSISSSGDAIAFISDVAGRPDLFLWPFKGSKPVQLFSYPRATQASSCFSPDGRFLSFVSDKDGTPRIYIINLLDGNLKRKKRPEAHLITRKYKGNVTPSWSPDGTKMAYSAKVDGIRQIFLYDFEKKQEEQITKGKENKENPCWASDSLHIIYNTEDSSSSELYLIDINRREAVKISSNEGKKRFPVWERRKVLYEKNN